MFKQPLNKNRYLMRNWLLFWFCLLAFTSSLTISTALGADQQGNDHNDQKGVGGWAIQKDDSLFPAPGLDDEEEARNLSKQLELTAAGEAIFMTNEPLFSKIGTRPLSFVIGS